MGVKAELPALPSPIPEAARLDAGIGIDGLILGPSVRPRNGNAYDGCRSRRREDGYGDAMPNRPPLVWVRRWIRYQLEALTTRAG